jgi:diguanylate cyclase (GGDEF)-like protein
MDITLPLQNILELTFNVLNAAVGIVVIILGLRVTSRLTLSTHRRALWISFGAVALIVVSNMARVWANFSRISTFKDVGGAFAELVAVCSVGLAVHLLERAEKEEVSPLRREANLDDLTGLGNRSFFHRAAKRRMELYERNSLPLACAVVDVDDFKFYNDNYGHEGGDAVLRCLAGVLGECTRADDLVARYGGDEFVMLLGGDVEDAIKVAERVREKVELECLPQEEEAFLGGSLTVSVGVATLGEDTATLQQLIRAADEELYRAKAAGKNRVAAVERR